MGKGSSQRPTDPKALAENWERTFGKRSKQSFEEGIRRGIAVEHACIRCLGGCRLDAPDCSGEILCPNIERPNQDGFPPNAHLLNPPQPPDEPWPGNPS